LGECRQQGIACVLGGKCCNGTGNGCDITGAQRVDCRVAQHHVAAVFEDIELHRHSPGRNHPTLAVSERGLSGSIVAVVR